MTHAFHLIRLATVFALSTAPAVAQTVLSGNHSVDGSLCAGLSCTGSETFFGANPLKLKAGVVGIYFEDVSGAGDPNADWEIKVNDIFPGGQNYFAIRDSSANHNVLLVENSAPENSLYLDDNGFLGLGTSNPLSSIHVEAAGIAGLRLHRNTGAGLPRSDWRVTTGSYGFAIENIMNFNAPIIIENGATSNALRIDAQKNIGLGTEAPSNALHVQRTDGTASVLVENTSASPVAVREMFKMANNGGSYFTLANTVAGTEWFFVHENASPNRFIITDGVADGPEMTLTADGILTVEGGFVAGSTTLNVPDYVFAKDYALRPLAEVASFIATNSHLPDVPSAAQIADKGLNMTDMQMALLKKVEELTLYTLEQDRINTAQERIIDAQARVMADLKAEMELLKARIQP